jgi:hypothetical protein
VSRLAGADAESTLQNHATYCTPRILLWVRNAILYAYPVLKKEHPLAGGLGGVGCPGVGAGTRAEVQPVGDQVRA